MKRSTSRSYATDAARVLGAYALLLLFGGMAFAAPPDPGGAPALAYARAREPQLLLRLARSALAQGRSREAQCLYRRFLKEADYRTLPADRAEAARSLTGPTRSAPILKGYLDRAAGAFAAQRYDEAVDAFATAYALEPTPLLLFDIAQVYRKAGQKRAALVFYGRFLDEDPGSTMRAEVEGHLADLRQQLEAEGSPRAVPPRPLPPAAVAVPAPEQRVRPLRMAKWVLGAAGLAAVLAGATLWGLDGYQSCPLAAERRCPLELDTQAPGIALVAVGGAALVTSAVLFGIDSRRGAGGTHAALLTLSRAF